MTKRLPPFDSIRASVTSSSTRSHLKMRILNAASLTTNKKQTSKHPVRSAEEAGSSLTAARGHTVAWRLFQLPPTCAARAHLRVKSTRRVAKMAFPVEPFKLKDHKCQKVTACQLKITLLILEALLILKRRWLNLLKWTNTFLIWDKLWINVWSKRVFSWSISSSSLELLAFV